MKAGWRDAPLALRDSVVSNMRKFFSSKTIISLSMHKNISDYERYSSLKKEVILCKVGSA